MSEQNVLPAKGRDRAGKGAARATRREGLVPGVVYGGSKEPSMIALDPRVIWKGLESGHFYSTIYTIDVDGAGKEQALARDVQFHPVTDQPLHVDFVRVSKNTEVNVMVPVVFNNVEDSVGVREGGIFNVLRHEVELVCTAANMPQEVEVDVANFEVGDTIRMSDVTLPKGVTPAITDRDFVVANINAPAGPSADAEEGEEGEEAVAEEAAAEEAASEE